MRLLVLMLGAGVVACSEEVPPAAQAPAPAAATTTPAEITEENQGVLTDTQREGLNAANQVSNLLDDANEARRKQLEAAEGR